FFCQGEGGIGDWSVTGVQTCALPISLEAQDRDRLVGPELQEHLHRLVAQEDVLQRGGEGGDVVLRRPVLQRLHRPLLLNEVLLRSEERRVGERGWIWRGAGSLKKSDM